MDFSFHTNAMWQHKCGMRSFSIELFSCQIDDRSIYSSDSKHLLSALRVSYRVRIKMCNSNVLLRIFISAIDSKMT